MTDLLNELANLFSRAHPLAQFSVLLSLIAVIIIGILLYLRGWGKRGRLKMERDRLRNEARDKELMPVPRRKERKEVSAHFCNGSTGRKMN